MLKVVSKYLLCSLLLSTTTYASINAIEHTPVEYVEPDKRFVVSTIFKSKSGINNARTYFKTSMDSDYFYVNMECNEINDGSKCLGILPAPSTSLDKLSYVVLVESGNKKVTKTQTFSTVVLKKDKVDQWKAMQVAEADTDAEEALKNSPEVLDIYSERSDTPTSLNGFNDKVNISNSGNAPKLGVISGLVSRSSVNTTTYDSTQSSRYVNSGTTAATPVQEDKGGMSGWGWAGIGLGAAAVATAVGGTEEDSTPATTTNTSYLKVQLQWYDCSTSRNDLDLYVLEPSCSSYVYYNNSTSCSGHSISGITDSLGTSSGCSYNYETATWTTTSNNGTLTVRVLNNSSTYSSSFYLYVYEADGDSSYDFYRSSTVSASSSLYYYFTIDNI